MCDSLIHYGSLMYLYLYLCYDNVFLLYSTYIITILSSLLIHDFYYYSTRLQVFIIILYDIIPTVH